VLPDTVSRGCRVRGALPDGKAILVTTPLVPEDVLETALLVEALLDEAAVTRATVMVS